MGGRTNPSPRVKTKLTRVCAVDSVGFYGQGNMPTICRAGGNGPLDYVCQQVSPVTIVIDS